MPSSGARSLSPGPTGPNWSRGALPMPDAPILPSPILKPAALFDFDGTLIGCDSLLVLLGHTCRRFPRALGSLGPLAAAVPAFIAGRISRDALKESALGVLRHVPTGHREDFFADFCRRSLAPRLRPQGLRRIEWHREQRHLLVLVSASIDHYLRPVSTRLGFDHLVCTRVILDPSPHLDGPNCRGDEKVRRLLQEPFSSAIRWEESWAYGDSLADLPLLKRCGHPVAVRPASSLRRRALHFGWTILDW